MSSSDRSARVGTTSRKRRLRAFLLVVAVAVVVSAGIAVFDALRVAREVRAGRAEFATIADIGLAARGGLHDHAVRGMRRFESARKIAEGSRSLGLWARVPLVGRPARWLRAASTATASLSRAAADAIGRIEPGLENLGGPSGRLAFLRLLDDQLSTLSASVARVHLPSTGGFLPPVNAANRELQRDLTRLREALADGIAGTRGLSSLLEGPSAYLVLAANNAEMRAGGMVLQAGVLGSTNGRMTAGFFRSTSALVLDKPVKVPPQIDALYGWLDPGTEWRNVGSSPNFPVTAPIYASMAERLGGRPVDGVMQIDVLGVRALLDVVGPVEVLGRRYDATNVERLVLHDLYAEFGGQQIDRRQEFSKLATATFQALNERPWRFERLAKTLREAALGRHLLAWSRRPVEQEAWRRLQMDGSLVPDGLMVTVQNHTGNKLDWFVRPSLDLQIERRAGGWRRATLRIRIENPTPPGEPTYVAGDGTLVPPGAHRALVAVYLPEWATNVEIPGSTVAIVGPDGPMRVIGTRVDIAQGKTVEIDVEFSIPPDDHQIVLLPSGRARPVPFAAGRLRLDDAVARALPI